MKHIFILACLLPAIHCRTSARQWQDGDNRQNCTEICSDECTSCKEPQLCDEETEIKCGETPQDHDIYDLVVNCPGNDVCIPKGCECPSNPECNLVCEVSCEDDELLCPGDVDENGCRENDYCHPKGTGNGGETCPGFCPFDCKEEEFKCPVPNDPITGCEVPSLCIPKQKDGSGEYCDLQQCPLICDPDSQQLCLGYEDHTGCKTADECVDNCGESCPIECGDEEIKCPQQADCDNNCVDEEVCKPLAKDINNEACPDDSASHDCPINCCGDTVLCPAEEDALGCLGPQECTPTTKGMNNATCPHHSDCPTICEPNEVKCPVTETDDNGCKLPDECILQTRDYAGELCTVHCPIDCDDDETWCPGQRNEMGCFEPDQCVTRAVKTVGNDKGGLCPGWCPPICLHGQIKCPSQIDPCDGCPTEEVCVDAATDINGEFCPVDPLSMSHGCPILCDDLKGEVLCPSKENSNGCKEPGVCMARTVDTDGQYCPAHSVCPNTCADDEIACTYGVDERGCEEATLCRAKGKNFDDELCDGVCPPTCKAFEFLTSNGNDARGCEIASSCVPIA